MVEERNRPSFCLARIRAARHSDEDLRRIVSGSLRATDTVHHRGRELLIAIPGDESAARAAVSRILATRSDSELAVTVLTRDHPEFQDLAADMGWPREIPNARPVVPSGVDPLRPATAVVVDDEVEVRRMLASLLSFEGWIPLVADGRQDVIELCRGSAADVLILDYHLGRGRSGLEWGTACRGAGLTLPMIMFAGSSWPGAAEDAARIDAAVISKRNVDDLISALELLGESLRCSHRRSGR
ncbi:MAG TPA: response regulator [Acidimicrobiales bacterium]|nr:response regulator [Acidimicrobiales bacterium]